MNSYVFLRICLVRGNCSQSDQTENYFSYESNLWKRHVFPTPIRECFNPPHPPPSPFSSVLHRLPLQGQDFETAWFPTRLFSFVLSLYSFVPPGMSFPLGCCTSFVFRLYSFVPPGMSFPLGFCAPSVLVCTRWYSVCIRLYRLGCCFPEVFVFRLYSFVLSPRFANIILLGDGRSTKVKMRKCDPSIVLGARWPNGITTARATGAPDRQRKGGALACVRAYVCAFTKAFSCLSSRTARGEAQTLKLV